MRYHWQGEVAARCFAVPEGAEELATLLNSTADIPRLGLNLLTLTSSEDAWKPRAQQGDWHVLARFLELPDLAAALANTPPEVTVSTFLIFFASCFANALACPLASEAGMGIALHDARRNCNTQM